MSRTKMRHGGKSCPLAIGGLPFSSGRSRPAPYGTAVPPVCKIINFGKFKYELAKKDKIQKKHQHVSLLKELRFHPNTDVHDFDFKVRHARRFLGEGHKVKATVVFKGREITYKEKGEVLLTRLVQQLTDISKIDQSAHMEGRSMIMILSPEKKKLAKPEQKAAEA